MREQATTIWTPTYNKASYLYDAACSVFMQQNPNWYWWIILDGADDATVQAAEQIQSRDRRRVRVIYEDCTQEQRAAEYRPAVLHNKYVPQIETEYFATLADDDLLDPIFVQILTGHIKLTGRHIAYGACRCFRGSHDRGWVHDVDLTGSQPFGPGLGSPDCVIDGGQILQRWATWDAIGWNLPTAMNEHTRHVDGIYLAKLAQMFDFQPVVQFVLIHRRTPISTWNKA